MTSSPSAPTASVVVLSRALDQTADVLDRIHEQQLDLPTPCTDWDVRRLLAHVVTCPRNLLELVRGNEVDWSAAPAPITVGWSADFRSAADDLIHHWHQLGDEADPGQVDWQTAEFAVHTWDLCTATGQDVPLDEEVAERGLAFMTDALKPEIRAPAFGPEVAAPTDAPVYDRLAAFAGRTPTR
jgi:uncharacterized protein (TIGR03086 family)